jgi:polyisoprenyl-teichoic acid--peptidoglycan teichoic acid transferase
MRRTWPQRFALGLGSVTTLGCLSTGASLWFANQRLVSVKRVVIDHKEATPSKVVNVANPSTTEFVVPELVDKKAINFLLVGSDSRDCIDPNSPYAGAFLGEEGLGYNSDTIMMVRVDPVTSSAAMLSFPRDLWVKMPNSSGRNKINSVYSKKNPSRLIQTLEQNFTFRVDHYIDVDFCAFKDIVDAVDGVSVPFIFPAFDKHTGLNVDVGCHKFQGDEGLAYVRSRYYQWYDGKRWRDDGDADLSRIARQQDFIKRALQKAIDKGARKPLVAKKLLDIGLDHVTLDRDLKVNDILVLAQSLKSLDPTLIKSYRIEGTFAQNGDVIIPNFDDQTNKAVLAVFRGQARLASAPGSTVPTTIATTTTVVAPTTAAPPGATTAVGESTTTAAPTTTSSTIVVDVKENRTGVVPPNDPSCR